MRACAAGNDLDGLVASDVEFHRAVCEASGSRRLLQAWETLNPARWTLVSGLRATDLSLEQIEKDYWGDPPVDATRLIETVHRLRRKPIGLLDAEDVRVLLGQRVGVEVLVGVHEVFARERLDQDIEDGRHRPLVLAVFRQDHR